MGIMRTQRTKIIYGDGANVSGLFVTPARARAIYVFAHGAGADMSHIFMEEVAHALADRDIATLRFNFPFLEGRFLEGRAGKWGRTDPPALAQQVVRAATAHARERAPGLSLFVGGKSFGARMASQAQAERPLEGASGLVFIGFPLHLAKRPSVARAQHLKTIQAPMLFVQGTRDALAQTPLLQEVCASLPLAGLHLVEGADHGFGVLVKSGRGRADVVAEVAAVAAEWMMQQSGHTR